GAPAGGAARRAAGAAPAFAAPRRAAGRSASGRPTGRTTCGRAATAALAGRRAGLGPGVPGKGEQAHQYAPRQQTEAVLQPESARFSPVAHRASSELVQKARDYWASAQSSRAVVKACGKRD